MEELRPRKLYLTGEINDQLCTEIMAQIDYINECDQDTIISEFEKALDVTGDYNKSIQLASQNSEPEPITLIINSGGGSVDAGLSLIETIRNSKTPIHADIRNAYSMALLVAIGCNKRIGHRTSRVMHHQTGYGIAGTLKDHQQYLAEAFRHEKIMDDYIEENTCMTREQIESVFLDNKDMYLYWEDMLEFGIVDEVIGVDEEEQRIIMSGNRHLLEEYVLVGDIDNR
jgi:ATP-dependent Clp protease protease subunit